MTESILGILNPTLNTLKGFKILHNVLKKEGTLLESGICTLHNDFIRYQCSSNIQKLLSDWQKLPSSDLNIACFRPLSIFNSNCSDAISMHSIGHIAVTCFGVINNISEMSEELTLYGYQLDNENVAETLCYLLNTYLDSNCFSPVEAMQAMITNLKGRFAIMALVMRGKWLMVECRGYPLVIGKNNQTVYLSTDAETLVRFSPSKILVVKKTKPSKFCATSFQSKIILLNLEDML